MQTLFARLTAPPLVYKFTADLTAGDSTLYNVSGSTSDLFVGMPVSGPGIPADASIMTIEPAVTIGKRNNTGALYPVNVTTGGFGITLTQGFVTTGRRLLPWANVTNQPALFVVDGNEDFPGASAVGGVPGRGSSGPARSGLQAVAWIYVKLSDPNGLPGAIINVLLDALEKALGPDPKASIGNWQNLGLAGVIHCRIEGPILKDGGHLDGQGICHCPIAIQVAQNTQTRVL